MKNFELQYPIEGATALNPRCEEIPTRCGTIIAFPGQEGLRRPAKPSCGAGPKHARPEEGFRKAASPEAASFLPSRTCCAQGRLMHTELVSNLRYGNVRGVAFGRAERWQAVAAGCVFAALAFATLFVGI